MAHLPTFPDGTTPARLAGLVGQPPPMAQVLSRLQQLLADVNSGLDDVAALIRLDSALTARVVQISNSAWFGRGSGCRTIEDAVNRVGFKEVYHVASVAASRALVAQPLTVYGRDALAMWRESVACAFAGELLAEQLGEDAAVAYMTGLLHAVGRLPINASLAAITGDATRRLTDEAFPADHSADELVLLGFTQADVGACLLGKWGFSAENIEPVRYQYQPLSAEVPHDRLSGLLYCARFLRSTLCQPQPPPESAEAEDVFASLRLTREDVLACLPRLQQQVTRAMEMMKG